MDFLDFSLVHPLRREGISMPLKKRVMKRENPSIYLDTEAVRSFFFLSFFFFVLCKKEIFLTVSYSFRRIESGKLGSSWIDLRKFGESYFSNGRIFMEIRFID